MKNLLTFGCSFTAPSGVDPNKSHHHEGSWPKELGNLLNYKVINKNSDTIIAVVFIVINVILISGLSDRIYYH